VHFSPRDGTLTEMTRFFYYLEKAMKALDDLLKILKSIFPFFPCTFFLEWIAIFLFGVGFSKTRQLMHAEDESKMNLGEDETLTIVTLNQYYD